MPHLFALVDCNNFYVSCERLFNQALEGRPVVVLGNNDGCVIARSNEAKALGISMGMPYFQCRELIECHQVVVFSSNYPLYQSLSDRIMRVLSSFQVPLEIYSIDEAFLDLSLLTSDDLVSVGQNIRQRIVQATGIPVSIGIAPTKTLAKIAGELAKKHPVYQGVVDFTHFSEREQDGLLASIHVEDVWGIGKQSGEQLRAKGMITARALKYADPFWARRHLTVRAERTVLELRGIMCIPLETRVRPRQGILSSLSFGEPIEALADLEEAVSCYAAWAAGKLRRQGSLTRQVSVFVQTNPFDRSVPQYAQSSSHMLPVATAFTPMLIGTACQLLREIYQPGYRYKKAGVYLSEITPKHFFQSDLFGEHPWEVHEKQQRLMVAVDRLNWFLGRDTLFFGAQGIQRPWMMKQRRRSPRYTTRWGEIPVIS